MVFLVCMAAEVGCISVRMGGVCLGVGVDAFGRGALGRLGYGSPRPKDIKNASLPLSLFLSLSG